MSNLYLVISDSYGTDINSRNFVLKDLLYFSKTEREAATITCKRYTFIFTTKLSERIMKIKKLNINNHKKHSKLKAKKMFQAHMQVLSINT